MTRSPIHPYIPRCEYYLFPATFFRTSRTTTAILRLPRFLHFSQRSVFRRIYHLFSVFMGRFRRTLRKNSNVSKGGKKKLKHHRTRCSNRPQLSLVSRASRFNLGPPTTPPTTIKTRWTITLCPAVSQTSSSMGGGSPLTLCYIIILKLMYLGAIDSCETFGYQYVSPANKAKTAPIDNT